MIRACLFIALSFHLLGAVSCSNEKMGCCPGTERIYDHEDFNPEHLTLVDSLINDVPLLRQVELSGLYLNTGFQFFPKNGSVYVTFLNEAKDSLVFVNLFGKGIRKTSASQIIDETGKYTLRIIGDTLHLIDINSYNYLQVYIDSNFAFKIARSYDLKPAFRSKKFFLNSNVIIDKKIVYQYPFLFLTYGNFNTRNFNDSKVIMKVNLESMKAEKILDYPVIYEDCDMFDFYSIIEPCYPNFALVFHKYDELRLVDGLRGGIEKQADSFFYNRFMCFDKNRGKDLAYNAKFFSNDESNDNLIYWNKSYYLLKQLRRETRRDSARVAMVIFNESLEHKATFFLSSSLQARHSFQYNNGIYVLNDSLTKAHYYAFSAN